MRTICIAITDNDGDLIDEAVIEVPKEHTMVSICSHPLGEEIDGAVKIMSIDDGK